MQVSNCFQHLQLGSRVEIFDKKPERFQCIRILRINFYFHLLWFVPRLIKILAMLFLCTMKSADAFNLK